ncbi:MAG TPA: ABC transporter permease [Candidatus Acidoferrales bacterium]
MFPNLRFSLRILRKHAKLTCIAILSLAIGMAAASVGLSTFNALLVQPPAVPEPNQLLTVYTVTPDAPFNQLSYPDYRYYRDNNQVFSGLCAMPYMISIQPLTFEHKEKQGLINAVSDNYFSVLALQPVLGRWFEPGTDDKPSKSVVLSYPYWKWLGSDRSIIGKSLTVNGESRTIIAVAPRGFAGTILTDLPDLWFPISRDADRTRHGLSLIGRMKPGVTRAQALANMQMLSTQLAAAYPETNKQRVAAVTKTSMLPPDSVSDAKFLGTLILAIVALVLFAACANVANLLLALAGVRRHEILIRAALGATRTRLIRQLLLDSAIISVAGGVLGFVLASYGLHRLLEFKPYMPGMGVIPITIDFRPDFAVLAAMFVVILAVGFATGLAPSLHASTPNLAAALSGEIAVGGTRKGRVRNLLVVAQVAACTIVLIGVGLCLKSLLNLRKVDLGFSARNVAILTLNDLQSEGDRHSEPQGRALYASIREKVAQLPGVESIALADIFPLGWSGNPGSDHVQAGDAPVDPVHAESIGSGNVDSDYFSTLGIPVLAGRVFQESDTPKSAEVIVVNHTMAEKFWPHQNPVGRTVRVQDGKRNVTVIGVVADTKLEDVDEEPTSLFYYALSQHYQSNISLLVRTQGKPAQLTSALEDVFQKLDPLLGYRTITMEENRNFAFYIPRLVLICISGFGGLAFLLAAAGLYGAVFYSVSERTREMGIRVALGAQQWDLWKLIFRQTSSITAVGIVLGIAGGIAASILARSLLYQIQTVEWLVLFGVAFVMLAMTIVTAYSAARPWMRVDPMKSVRHV